jgi:hypothetical protein
MDVVMNGILSRKEIQVILRYLSDKSHEMSDTQWLKRKALALDLTMGIGIP